jgi:hypothetical protein
MYELESSTESEMHLAGYQPSVGTAAVLGQTVFPRRRLMPREKIRPAGALSAEPSLLNVLQDNPAIRTWRMNVATKRERISHQLQMTREMALEEDRPSLTREAEEVCLAITANIIQEEFPKHRLQVVAATKLDGGASIVARCVESRRRVDIEIPPSGGNPAIIALDERRNVKRSKMENPHQAVSELVLWLLGRVETLR